MSVSKDSFGVDSVARRGGEATVVACGARTGGSLRLDAVSDDMEAGVPCSVVEVRAQIIRQHFKQFFNKHLQQNKTIGWRFGLVVTRWPRST